MTTVDTRSIYIGYIILILNESQHMAISNHDMRADTQNQKHGKDHGAQFGGKRAMFNVLNHSVFVRLPTIGSHI